jgi:hypothetical protein
LFCPSSIYLPHVSLNVVSVSQDAFCKTCGITVSFKKKSQLSQHIKTKMHQEALNFECGDTFYSDLCEAFTAANISLHKLQNPVLKGFLSKYTDRHIPDESTLRKNYIPGCYKKNYDFYSK